MDNFINTLLFKKETQKAVFESISLAYRIDRRLENRAWNSKVMQEDPRRRPRSAFGCPLQSKSSLAHFTWCCVTSISSYFQFSPLPFLILA